MVSARERTDQKQAQIVRSEVSNASWSTALILWQTLLFFLLKQAPYLWFCGVG